MHRTQIKVAVAGILLLGGLYMWEHRRDDVLPTHWGTTGVACVPGAHDAFGDEIRAQLSIFVDGSIQQIPAGVGISANCTAVIHTHDGTGQISIATVDSDQRLTLGDFFMVWEMPFEREGYERLQLLSGIPNTAGSELIIKNGQHIELHYVRIGAKDETLPTLEDYFPRDNEQVTSDAVLMVQ